MPLVAHHVEINLFDLIVIEPETMPQHAVLAAVSAVLVVLICYGVRAAIRDMRSWLERRRDTAAACRGGGRCRSIRPQARPTRSLHRGPVVIDAGAAWVERVAWRFAGDRLAATAGRRVGVWNAAGNAIGRSDEHASNVTDIAWEPGGRRIATVAYGVATSISGGREPREVRGVVGDGATIACPLGTAHMQGVVDRPASQPERCHPGQGRLVVSHGHRHRIQVLEEVLLDELEHAEA